MNAWEQRKLDKIVDVHSGRDYKHLNKGNIPVYGTGGYMLSVSEALSEKNDAIGIGRKGTIDKPYLLKAPFWTVDTLFYATPQTNNDLQFTLAIFKKINWKKYDESTGVPSLSKKAINNISAFLPSFKEQEKIGSFFQQLDDTITLHQRKLDKLKQLKQGYLQLLFPQNDEKVPRIRFANFDENWNLCNIKKLAKVFIGLVTSMTENYREEGTLLIRNSDIKSGKFEFADNPIYLDEQFAEKNNTRRLSLGDVITVHTGDIGTSAVIGAKESGAIGFATINTRPNENMLDSNYLSIYFNTTNHKNWATKMSTGDGRSNYNLYDFNRVMIPLPNLIEQKLIGAFLKKFNNIINLEQSKLNELKSLKEALLQKMFI
ncbi:restriction endonuclease subunit S [Lactococcus lactis]|uniref:restriction endonuclease subunit S n=1 Tax=Lactococcus lactis TaxID=1358 RepID=UPI0022E69545|nr:restriction endonuclease subunit S [Lactococcus lactis]